VFINAILGYIPNIFAAILILIVGAWIANLVAGIVRGAASEAGLTTGGLLSNIARWGILLFAALSALAQLNVAQNMIFILFAGLVAMLAIAGGLAFGLGGVESARSLLASQTMSSMLQPGQQVQIGQQSGKVVRHDMNATVLDTGNGLVSIPNGTLAREQVTVLNSSSSANGR
jgi:small-conductance mechanosensitive channel